MVRLWNWYWSNEESGWWLIRLMLFMLAIVGIIISAIIVIGNIFGWWSTEFTTHLNGQCEQFFQYVLIGKVTELISVNVCP